MNRPSLVPAPGTTALLIIGLLLLATVPGVVAAETRSGGTVVVHEGETIDDDLDAFGGTIVIRGTVNGDLTAFGGDIRVDGEVTGDVDAIGGTVQIEGSIGGDVDAAAGNVYLQPGSEIGGSLSAAAGNVLVAGAVRGDVELAAGAISLTDSAIVDGNVEYAVGEGGQFTNEGATVGGTVARTEGSQAGPWQWPDIPGWFVGIYLFLVNLVLGAALLLAFPRFSTDVGEQITSDPLSTAGIGLVALVGIPVLLIIATVTIVGIPLAIVGAIIFALLLWIALIYGRFAAGMWLLSQVGVENRWLGLLVGLVVLGLVARIPWAGSLVDLVVILLGLGALLALSRAGYRERRAGHS